MAITLKKKNFAKSTLASGITDSATQLTVDTGDGTTFPSSGKFRAVLWGSSYSNPSDDPDAEVVEAELNAGDVFDITRAKEGTSAQAWSAGDNFTHVLTAGTIEELEAAINHRGALVRRASAQSIPNGVVTAVNWDTEDYDTDGIHDNATNNERLTVPSGVSKVKLFAYQEWAAYTVGHRIMSLSKNGASYVVVDERTAGIGFGRGALATPAMDVTPGDYFIARVYQSAGGSWNFNDSGDAYFAMEIIK